MRFQCHSRAERTVSEEILNDTPIQPACAETSDGSPRRVGVEIEFAGLSCARAAAIVAARFGGEAREIDPYRFLVETTARGRFLVELDTQFVHGDEAADPKARAEKETERLREALEEGLRAAIGEVTKIYLPVEIICPPLGLEALPALDEIVAELRASGARGSKDSVVYAFGLQLNVDMPALDAETILAYLRAYLVSSDWLRAGIGVDLTRRVLPFIQPFPRSYLRHVLRADYAPDLATLIDDYLFYNPTRNRDLDVLPLFAWLAPDRVRAVVDDPRLKARPALHYRLPDSRVDDPDWRIVHEWNRWAVSVESLVGDRERLAGACAAYLSHLKQSWLGDWADGARIWLKA
jgi:hypothetical protein